MKSFIESRLGIAMFLIVALVMALMGYTEIRSGASPVDTAFSFIIAAVLFIFAARSLAKRRS